MDETVRVTKGPIKRIGGKLPAGAVPYKRTPEFTEKTIPAALRREHSTKPGVWGVINVLDGELRYVVPETASDIELDAETQGIIRPEQLHYVEPAGSVRFYVEFWKLADPG